MRVSDRTWYNVCQLYIATVCIGIGIVLTIPGSTFSSSLTYGILRDYIISEDQWGMIWTALGVACFISAYFTRQIMVREGDAYFTAPVITSMYKLFRLTWFLVTPLMIFWAWSFLLSNPATVGVVFFLATAALSQWVYWRVTKEARRHG